MKKLSIRMRLTLFVALLLTLLCLAFTLLVQRQMQSSLIMPMHSVIPITPAAVSPDASPMAEIEPAQPVVPAMEAALSQGERAFTSGLWLIMGGIVLTGSLLTYAVSALALKPIRDLSHAVDGLDEHTLTCRFEHFQTGDEVARLAESFDTLLARLRAAFERERRFSAYAAHELKTPLAVIKTALDVMDEEDYANPALCRETFQTIGRQNERMIGLSGQLLLLSRLQTEPKLTPVRVDRLMEEIADELRPLANQQNVRLSCRMTALETPGDATLLKHALSNIVENAVRYNFAGGSVNVSLDQRSLTVVDTGTGIPPEDVEHIFEPFYRVDKSRSRNAGGTGLGLAITREILTQCGASVRHEPNRPAGSRFVVMFPGISAETMQQQLH